MALVLLIIGVISLTFAIALLTSRYLASKKKKKDVVVAEEKIEEVSPVTEEIKEEAKVEEQNVEPIKEQKVVEKTENRNYQYQDKSRYSSSYSSSSTIYVKEVGSGPLLRIEGSRILDMRNNTYYRIEGNIVKIEGYGPRFEIRGSQIRDAFGGYLFEVSGSNINKIFGGFYASISGNYITIHDLSHKFEIADSLSTKQILVVAALLFD